MFFLLSKSLLTCFHKSYFVICHCLMCHVFIPWFYLILFMFVYFSILLCYLLMLFWILFSLFQKPYFVLFALWLKSFLGVTHAVKGKRLTGWNRTSFFKMGSASSAEHETLLRQATVTGKLFQPPSMWCCCLLVLLVLCCAFVVLFVVYFSSILNAYCTYMGVWTMKGKHDCNLWLCVPFIFAHHSHL